MTASSASLYWPISAALLTLTRSSVDSTAAVCSVTISTMTRRRSVRVGDPSDVAGLFEAIDDARDGAGGEAHQLGEPPGGRRAAVQQHLEGLDVGLGETEADGHGLAEEGALEVHPAKGPDDRIDVLAIHG